MQNYSAHFYSPKKVLKACSVHDTSLRHLALEEFKFGSYHRHACPKLVITFQDRGNVCSKTDQTFDKNWASPTESKVISSQFPDGYIVLLLLKK